MEDEDTAASRFLRSVDGETVDTPDDDIEETLKTWQLVQVWLWANLQLLGRRALCLWIFWAVSSLWQLLALQSLIHG